MMRTEHTPATPRQDWGARQLSESVWSVALWAPGADRVAVETRQGESGLARDEHGVHRGTVVAKPGGAYWFRVDGHPSPDPAARAQERDVHGWSVFTAPARVPRWTGRPWHDAVILEIHVGTFTTEGTLDAAATRLPALADTGITAVELMPLAQFSGTRGWGYDGVLPYAVHPDYGGPDALARFVAAAHEAGLMVLLDVVYNHFGPDGAYLHGITPKFFDEERHTPWGAAIDFTKPQVRGFFIDNALMWLEEFGIDGLRLDAVHELHDPSDPPFVAELCATIRARDFGRPIHIVAEDDRNLPDLRQASLLTAQWNDDYHHSVHCLLTGESAGYYASFAVDPMADLVTALARGHVEEGQPRPGRKTPRGAPSGHLPLTAFVNANQTHDQIGNRAQGERLIALAGPDAVRIAHALLLCAPAIPMLFMGEEIGARAPFQFFADFEGDLAQTVREGRAAEFAAFESFAGEVPDPLAPETFAASRPYDVPPPDAARWHRLTCEMLQFRRDRVMPLLASGRAGPALVTQTGPRSLHGIWPFHAGRLEIRANLGEAPDTAWTLPNAQVTLETGADAFAFAAAVAP